MEKWEKIGFFSLVGHSDLLVTGVQAGVPGYSVNLLLFTYWYFSSGHPQFTGRWCPNLNLVKISLSLSRLKSTHIPSDVHTLFNRSALENAMQKSDNEESSLLTNVQVKQLESILEVMQPLLTVAGE